MDQRILQKAQDRYRIAAKAIERMSATDSLEDQEDEWFTFLRAWKNIFTMLQQAVKGDPKAIMWFGKKSAFRRRDPLLQYLYQARNDDEHGLTRVTNREPGGIAFGKPIVPGPVHIGKLTISMVGGNIGIIDGGGHENFDPSFEFIKPSLRLLPVKDRDKAKTYNPPTEHMGRPFAGGTIPFAVAEAGLSYVSDLLKDAINL